MSGHSKWSTIKRKKGLQDSKRGKIFGKLSRDITIAVKEGGSADTKVNARLRLSIQNAQGFNMPKENIEKAIKKASKEGEGDYQPILYEGHGTNGVAIYVECLTDNINRTVSAVRHLFAKHGGHLAKGGSLEFLFERRGQFVLKEREIAEEALLALIEAGAEEIENEGDFTVIFCPFGDFGRLQKEIERIALSIESASLQRLPKTRLSLARKEEERILRLIDALEDEDDVQCVFHNMEARGETDA